MKASRIARASFLAASMWAFHARAEQPGIALITDPKAPLAAELRARMSAWARLIQAEPTLKAIEVVGYKGQPNAFLSGKAEGEQLQQACAAAQRLVAEEIVVVQRTGTGKKRAAHVVVVRATPKCEVLGETDLPLGAAVNDKKEATAIDAQIFSYFQVPGLSSDFDDLRSPSPKPEAKTEAPKPVDAPPKDAASTSEEDKSKDTTPPPPEEPQEPEKAIGHRLVLEITPAIGIRRFSYTEKITPPLLNFRQPAVLLMHARAEAFPFQQGFLSRLGISLELGSSVGLSTDSPVAPTQPGEVLSPSLDTQWSWFNIEARLRFPIRSNALVDLHAGYGTMSYVFFVPDGQTAYPPSVSYSHLRVGGTVKGAIGRLRLRARAEALFVLDGGTTSNRLSEASTFGLEFSAGIGVHVLRRVDLVLDGTYTRWASSFQPSGVFVAKGAQDQFARFELGPVFSFQ